MKMILKKLQSYLMKSPMNLELFGLVGILIFAFFLRIYSLSLAPFWVDESISSMASKMILDKGLPIFDSGLFYGRALLFHYVQAFFLLFGQTEFFARIVSVIFGLLTVVLAYFIGKKYYKSGGIICALFMSVFYLEVFFSRQARFYQMFQFLFFLSLYLLYESKKNPKYLYFSLVSFFITINTQIAGLVLAPFFIIHILIYNKGWRKYLSGLPAISFLSKFAPSKNLASSSAISSINYFRKYAWQTSNMVYLLVLFILGVIFGFIKNKRLTFLLVLPSIVLLVGVFNLKDFALRYAYFFVFPLVLYSSLFISFLYEKYGKIMLAAIFILLFIPSNLFFAHTYINMIKPIDHNYNDYSAPEMDFKSIPLELIIKMRKNTLMTLFSASASWYIKNPDYVFDFSMTGRKESSVSYLKENGDSVDVYSGALISDKKPLGDFYFILDYYSSSKLTPNQRDKLNRILEGCFVSYKNKDMKIYGCFE